MDGVVLSLWTFIIIIIIIDLCANSTSDIITTGFPDLLKIGTFIQLVRSAFFGPNLNSISKWIMEQKTAS